MFTYKQYSTSRRRKRLPIIIIILLFVFSATLAADTVPHNVPIFKSDNIQSTSNREAHKSLISSKQPKMPLSNNDQSFILLELTHNLEDKLKSIRNKELGIPYIQQIFDTMEFVSIQRNDTKLVTEMARKLSMKLSKAIEAINRTHEELRKNIFNTDQIYLHTFMHPCQYDELNGLDQHYDRKQIEIKNYQKTMVDQLRHIDPMNKNVTANDQLITVIKSINYTLQNFRQVYFLSHYDSASSNQCRTPDDEHFHFR